MNLLTNSKDDRTLFLHSKYLIYSSSGIRRQSSKSGGKFVKLLSALEPSGQVGCFPLLTHRGNIPLLQMQVGVISVLATRKSQVDNVFLAARHLTPDIWLQDIWLQDNWLRTFDSRTIDSGHLTPGHLTPDNWLRTFDSRTIDFGKLTPDNWLHD